MEVIEQKAAAKVGDDGLFVDGLAQGFPPRLERPYMSAKMMTLLEESARCGLDFALLTKDDDGKFVLLCMAVHAAPLAIAGAMSNVRVVVYKYDSDNYAWSIEAVPVRIEVEEGEDPEDAIRRRMGAAPTSHSIN